MVDDSRLSSAAFFSVQSVHSKLLAEFIHIYYQILVCNLLSPSKIVKRHVALI